MFKRPPSNHLRRALDMAAATAASPSYSPESQLPAALAARGWCLRDTERIQELITASATVDSVESELLNMDLRSFGGKCLPPPSLLCKTSHLQGPIVLQVCSSRDISRSSMAEASENSGNRRLLLLKLTDGHSEITAIEYSHVPSFPDDISPGTKVRLQGKADMRNGILCLNKKVITVLGGVVQFLYEEWQLKRKYMNVSRYKLRPSQENTSSCPPPFEKLQVRTLGRGTSSTSYTSSSEGMHVSVDTTGTSSNDHQQTLAARSGSQILQPQKNNATKDGLTNEVKPLHTNDGNPEKAVASERPKVAASVPVQNQVAAQKLLQKTSQPSFNDRNSRFQRRRGKDIEDDSSLLTLDEWERRKTGSNHPTTHEHHNYSQDEELARQLQEQFDLEENHVQNDPHTMDAKSIKMSMFSFERDDARASGRTEFRGRGRGRGRGRRY